MPKPRRCDLWPYCACHRQLLHWKRALADDSKDWSFEELRDAEYTIFITLRCIARFCPERKYRAWCEWQLTNPYFDRQHRGEDLTKEVFEEIRRGE